MSSSFSELPDDRMLVVNEICNRFEQACKEGEHPRIEDYLEQLDGAERGIAVRELVAIEIEHLRETGHGLAVREYVSRFPDLESEWITNLLEDSSYAEVAKPVPDRDDTPPGPLGEYDLLERIGGGGMGVVYRAMHRRMHRQVALKVLRDDLTENENLQKRFEREVRAAARLVHPNIVTAYDAGEDKGHLYLITEYIDGMDLSRRVKDRGPMSSNEAIHCVLEVAKGLQYAHENQVIHRDIKPANLLIDTAGGVKILDMGLARLDLDSTVESESELTRSGTFMGTAAFMAPEQARNTKNADARSDIYSLGCVLYYLLVGRAMYGGETVVDTILAHATHPLPSLASQVQGVPPELDQIFQRMIAKQPEQRFQTTAQLIEALQPLRDSGDSVAHGLASPVVLASDSTAENAQSLAPTIAIGNVPETTKPGEGSQANRWWPLMLIAGLAVAALFVIPIINAFLDGDDPPAPPQNYALRCNGKTYALVESLPLDPESPYTLEARFRLRNQDSPGNLMTWLGTHWMAMYRVGDKVGIGRLQNGTSLLTEMRDSMDLKSWTHFAATWDGRELNFFVNGLQVPPSSNNFTMDPTEGGGLYMGGCDPTKLARAHSSRFLNGDIDAIRISNIVRYESAFGAPTQMESDEHTLAMYQFDQQSGIKIIDSSPNKHHGTVINPQWVPSDSAIQ